MSQKPQKSSNPNCPFEEQNAGDKLILQSQKIGKSETCPTRVQLLWFQIILYIFLFPQDLIKMVHTQRQQIHRKDNMIKDLEGYIDNLLVRKS